MGSIEKYESFNGALAERRLTAKEYAFEEQIERAVDLFLSPYAANELEHSADHHHTSILIEIYYRLFQERGGPPDVEDINMEISLHNHEIILELAREDYELRSPTVGYSQLVDCHDQDEDDAIGEIADIWWEDFTAGYEHYDFFEELYKFYVNLNVSYVDNYSQPVGSFNSPLSPPSPLDHSPNVRNVSIVAGDAQHCLLSDIHIVNLADRRMLAQNGADMYIELSFFADARMEGLR